MNKGIPVVIKFYYAKEKLEPAGRVRHALWMNENGGSRKEKTR